MIALLGTQNAIALSTLYLQIAEHYTYHFPYCLMLLILLWYGTSLLILSQYRMRFFVTGA